jgi:hypothetical protein
MLGAVRIVCLLLILDTIASAQSAAPESDKSPVATGATSDQSDSMEQPLPGDHWTYEVHDEITGNLKFTTTNLITDLTATEISIRTENLGLPGIGFLVYDRNWNLKSNPTWKYSPNDGTGVKIPAKSGATWKFQSNDLSAQRGVSFKRSGSSKIVAEESITTAAGTFNTFKIETSIIARNANDPTKKFEFAMTTWYAPQVNHWVKRISKTLSDGHVSENTAYELVEYGRR